MTIQSLVYAAIWILFIIGCAYGAVHLLTKAQVPGIIINIVWIIAALLVILVMLNHAGVVHIGALSPADIRSLLA